ncbi:MAG: site-specific DNA-methyltransferase, partial [Clostridiales bacterium]|nr:site-specific DNA-methyltransferase [Clostridiales bacterium]
VIQFSAGNHTMHPTQKPVELCEYLIRTYTNAGQLVADICAGSGTTAVAAIRTGRRFICFESAPQFYALASERIRKTLEETSGQNVQK